MKVLMLSPFPVPYPRGSPIKALETAEMVLDRKHVEKVTLLSYRSPMKKPKTGIELVSIGSEYNSTGFGIWRLICDIKLTLKAIYLARKGDYDIIHAHNTESAFAAYLIKKMFKSKALAELHGDLNSELSDSAGAFGKIISPFVGLLERIILKGMDCVVVINRIWEQELKESGIEGTETVYPTSRIEKIPERYRPGSGRNVLYTGSFRRYQGLDMLIESAEAVVDRFPGVQFILVGNDEGGKYRKIVKDMGLEGNFRFTGFLSKDEIGKYYEMADVLVIPRPESRIARYAMPRKITDYMSARRAIVATNVGDHKSMLGGACMLVEPSSRGLSEGIIDLLSDGKKRSRLSEKSFHRLMRYYSWETTKKRYIGIYRKIMKS